jgi:hypothetical protein
MAEPTKDSLREGKKEEEHSKSSAKQENLDDSPRQPSIERPRTGYEFLSPRTIKPKHNYPQPKPCPGCIGYRPPTRHERTYSTPQLHPDEGPNLSLSSTMLQRDNGTHQTKPASGSKLPLPSTIPKRDESIRQSKPDSDLELPFPESEHKRLLEEAQSEDKDNGRKNHFLPLL